MHEWHLRKASFSECPFCCPIASKFFFYAPERKSIDSIDLAQIWISFRGTVNHTTTTKQEKRSKWCKSANQGWVLRNRNKNWWAIVLGSCINTTGYYAYYNACHFSLGPCPRWLIARRIGRILLKHSFTWNTVPEMKNKVIGDFNGAIWGGVLV